MGTWVHRISNIDEERAVGDCAECGPSVRLKRKKDGWRCYTAERRYRGYRTVGRSLAGKRLGDLIEAQGGCCAICNDELTAPCVDHDHDTRAVRGILCHHCNVGIGHFRDDVVRLASAIAYLERTKKHPAIAPPEPKV
jgi:hypothetical protein